MKKATALLLVLVTLLGVLLTGCYRKGSTRTVMTVGGYKVSEETYRYVRMKNAVWLFGGTENLGQTEEERLREATEKELRRYYAIEKLAKDYDVGLTKDDNKEIKAQLKEYKKTFEHKKDYYAALEERYMSENVYFLQTENYYLERNLFYYMKDEASGVFRLSDSDLIADVKAHFYAATQILLTGDRAKERLAKIREEIVGDGSDSEAAAKRFLEAVGKYSEDTNKGVRYCAEGEMLPEYENAALALKTGEISEVFESELGAHLVMRGEIDDGYVDSHLEAFRDTDIVRLYNELVDHTAAEMEINYK